LKFHVPPWQHQVDAIRASIDKHNYALFFEQGTGKTATIINMLRYKFTQKNRLLKTVIFAPPITLENWKREFKMHAPAIDQKNIITFSGPQTRRLKLFAQTCTDKSKYVPNILITNYEALLMDEFYNDIFCWGPECLVLDESHKCKSMTSQRTKKMIRLADRIPIKFLATGTPVLKDPMDLFAQFRILDGGDTFGKNPMTFKRKYFEDKNAHMPKQKYFPNWQFRSDMSQSLKVLMGRSSMRVKKSECLDLPPLVKQTYFIELESKQKAAYKEMEKDFIAYTSDLDACEASTAMTKALRLNQIISGYMPTDNIDTEETTLRRFEPNPRLLALKELLEELTPDHKVIVWAVFKENYKMISELLNKLDIKFVEVHGGVSSDEKIKNVDEFNNNPEVRVFLGNPASGGIGINLVVSDISIFYNRSFSLEHDLQAEARNYRGGSERHAKITRIDLVAQGTIDEKILQRLHSKESISESVIRDLGREMRNGLF
jgi:SNF2 family DNA or RNA helicase